MIGWSTPGIGFKRFLLNDLRPRAFNVSQAGGGSAATAIYAPSGPSGRGELPPKGCISAVTKKIKIENEQSEITPLVCLDAQRPSA